MLNQINQTALRAGVTKSVAEVFDSMLSMQVVALEVDANIAIQGDRVVGSVGFGGAVAGMICIQVSEEFSQRMTAAMLGIELDEVNGSDDVNDAIGEIANMIAGNVKAYFSTPQAPCSLSVPSIVRGSKFEVEAVSSAEHDHFVFKCGEQYVLLELYVKAGK